MGLFGSGRKCQDRGVPHDWKGWHQKPYFSSDWFNKCRNCGEEARRKYPPF